MEARNEMHLQSGNFWLIGTTDMLNTQPFQLSVVLYHVFDCLRLQSLTLAIWRCLSSFSPAFKFCQKILQIDISKLFFSFSELMKNGDIVRLELQP